MHVRVRVRVRDLKKLYVHVRVRVRDLKNFSAISKIFRVRVRVQGRTRFSADTGVHVHRSLTVTRNSRCIEIFIYRRN